MYKGSILEWDFVSKEGKPVRSQIQTDSSSFKRFVRGVPLRWPSARKTYRNGNQSVLTGL